LNRPQEAEAAFREALAIQVPLVAAFPTLTTYRFELALTQLNLGALLRDSPRHKESAAALNEALNLLKQLTVDNPDKLDYRSGLGKTLINFGELAIKDRKYAEACAQFSEALPHCQACLRAYPKGAYYLETFRDLQKASAEARLGLGEYVNAAVAAQQLLRIEFEPATNAYHAARFLCRCQVLAGKDAKLSEAKRKELMQAYSDNALTALRKAVASGNTDAAKMKQDKDLETLRSREDFQKLLSELEAKQKANGR
jgi:serine/threonine-protein kinase